MFSYVQFQGHSAGDIEVDPRSGILTLERFNDVVRQEQQVIPVQNYVATGIGSSLHYRIIVCLLFSEKTTGAYDNCPNCHPLALFIELKPLR